VYAAPRAGVVRRVEPRAIGWALATLGGGRQRLDDAIDPAVGFVITVKPGDRVAEGEPIASVFARDQTGAAGGCATLARAIEIGDSLDERPRPLVSHRVTQDGVEELAKPRVAAAPPQR
jgi:thymidine phosphorylase